MLVFSIYYLLHYCYCRKGKENNAVIGPMKVSFLRRCVLDELHLHVLCTRRNKTGGQRRELVRTKRVKVHYQCRTK